MVRFQPPRLPRYGDFRLFFPWCEPSGRSRPHSGKPVKATHFARITSNSAIAANGFPAASAWITSFR